MQLSLLQSRLVASLAATFCLLAIYFLLLAPRGALAYELSFDSFSSSPAGLDAPNQVDSVGQSPAYEPIFSLFSRSILGRAGDVIALENDKPLAMNIAQLGGTPICYIVKKGSLGVGTPLGAGNNQKNSGSDGSTAQNATIYLSANTCLQPTLKAGSKSSKVPQLMLFVSNGTTAACPQVSSGPNGDEAKGFTAYTFTEGAVTVRSNATTDVYIGVYAPKIADGSDGPYNYEIAASSSEFFHRYQDAKLESELLWMDSDSTSALLVTQNLASDVTESRRIMGQDPPYQLYVSPQDSPRLDGLHHSACGLQMNAPTKPGTSANAKNAGLIKTNITLRGRGGLPKQQFYVVGLNATTTYSGMLVRPANVSVNSKRQQDGGQNARRPGSIVFGATEFKTNGAPNCKVVTDLKFCDEVQYAVPGNDAKFNNTELGRVYDEYAEGMYANFLKVMQQIPCEADSTSRYSLARTCEDCKNAYKRWLCTVSLPRCEDFLGGSFFSVIRNVNQAFPNGTLLPADLRGSLAQMPSQNASRNSFVDTVIQPGPYREIMPCDGLCYQVVQSCPAALKFKCPLPYKIGYNSSYQNNLANPRSTVVSCNFPGQPRTPTSAAAMLPALGMLHWWASSTAFLFLVLSVVVW